MTLQRLACRDAPPLLRMGKHQNSKKHLSRDGEIDSQITASLTSQFRGDKPEAGSTCLQRRLLHRVLAAHMQALLFEREPASEAKM